MTETETERVERLARTLDIQRVGDLRKSFLMAGHSPSNLPRLTAADLERFGLTRWDGKFCGMTCEAGP